jgi:hypothetical protein
VDGFTEEMAAHCALMADRRNAELHSGVVGFDEFDNAAWLPATFETIEVLLKHLGTSFEGFLGGEHAATAIEMLRDRRESIKKEVLDRVSAAKRAFDLLSEADRAARSESWATRMTGWIKDNPVRRACVCPACGSSAVMTGDKVSRGPVRIDERNTTIEREVRVLPTKFWCPICELGFDGFQEMRQARLGAIYTVNERILWY